MLRDLLNGAALMLRHPAMLDDPEQTPTEDLVKVWALLTRVGDAVEKRKKAIRKVLLARVETHGSPTEKGGQRVTVKGSLVLRERRRASQPDDKGLRDLLGSHGIDLAEGFSKTIKVVPDPSKLEALVNLGQLQAASVEKLHKVTWALRVKPSHALNDVIDEAIRDRSEVEVDGNVKPRTKKTQSSGQRRSSGQALDYNSPPVSQKPKPGGFKGPGNLDGKGGN